MVKIRLTLGGSKKRAFYHIVATDQRNKRDGRSLERLGYYNPIAGANENETRAAEKTRDPQNQALMSPRGPERGVRFVARPPANWLAFCTRKRDR